MTVSVPKFPEVPVLLVDGDIVAYRAAAAAEKTHYLVVDGPTNHYFDNAKDAKAFGGTYIWSRKEVQPESFAIECAQSIMDAIARRFTQPIVQVYLSGERNFRDAIWKTKRYKGNRTAEKPRHLEAVRQALISRWYAVVSQNQEADDDIGIASGLGTVVCSTDKDLDQIPGWHYNFVKEELYFVNEHDAEQYLWEQVISGDAVDNIPGLPGYGPAKARKYLDEFFNHEASVAICTSEAVLSLFEKEGFDEEYMIEMHDLVRIKQSA